MTLDTSAVVAILRDEVEKSEFLSLVDGAARNQISTVSLLELTMVLEGKKDRNGEYLLDQFVRMAGIIAVPFDQDQLRIARSAFRRYGKGRHKAGLNFGDCAAYALSQWSGEPLLYKGNDFAATDVSSARNFGLHER